MANIGTLAVSLVAKTNKFEKGLGRAKKSLASFSKMASGLAIGAVVAGAGLAMTALAVATRRAFTEMDELAKRSDRIGMMTESLVSLQRAASRAGASSQELDNALERMNRVTGEAMMGNQAATRAFQNLGLSVEEISRMPAERRLGAIADGLKAIEHPALRAAAANQIFGQRSRNVLNMLQQGSGALDESRRKAEELGITFSRFDAAKIEQANDAWQEMMMAVQGIGNQIAVYLAPMIEFVAKKATNFLVSLNNETKGYASLLDSIANGVFGFVGGIIDVTNALWQTVKTGIMGLQAMTATFTSFGMRMIMDLINSAVNGVETIAQALGKLPGPIGAGARAGIGAIESMRKSVLNGMEETTKEAQGIAKELNRSLIAQGDKMQDAWGGFFEGRTAVKMKNGWDSIMADAEERAAITAGKVQNVFGDTLGDIDDSMQKTGSGTQRAGVLDAGSQVSVSGLAMSGAASVEKDQLGELRKQTQLQEQTNMMLRQQRIAVTAA